MTITEAINKIKEDKEYTDDNINILKESVLSSDIAGFNDPKLKEFIDFINEEPFDSRIQEIVNGVVEKMSLMGILSPCMGGCSSDCAFHEAEFGGV